MSVLEAASVDVCPKEKVPTDTESIQGLLDKMILGKHKECFSSSPY